MVNKRVGKIAAIVTTAAMLAGMFPAAALASNASEGVTSSMDAKSSSSVKAGSSGAAEPQSSASSSNAAISKEKAEQIARKAVNIPEDYQLQSANLSTSRLMNGTRNSWGLNFNKRVNGRHMGSIYATVNAESGQLTSYSYHNPSNVKPSYPLKVEREEAQRIASNFVDELAVSYASQVKLNESFGEQLLPALTGEVRHQFKFDRYVNDLPFLENYITVVVNSEGHVVEYEFVWDDTIQFPKPDSYLSVEDALKKLRAAGTPELKYKLLTNRQGKNTPILTYELQSYAIDASTGNKIDDTRNHYSYLGEVADKPLTTNPLGLKPANKAIKENQAIENVKSAFKLPENIELGHSSYHEYNDTDSEQARAMWEFSWTIKKDGQDAGSIWATVNAQTGAVQGFNIYYYNEEGSEKSETISVDQATSTAIEAVKKQLPWLTHELYLIKPDPKQQEIISSSRTANYQIRFAHKLHNALIEYDQVNVSINSRTGNITGFEANIQPFDYPAQAPKAISIETALDRWMDYYKAELTYRVSSEYTWIGEPIPLEKYNVLLASGEIDSNEDIKVKSTVNLVYRLRAKPLDQHVFLDAATGEWRSMESGEVTTLERPEVLDIEGHWAQRQLELMVAYKALDVVDGKVRPNETIKRGELIKMLVIARNGGSNYGYAVATADSALKSSFNDVSASSEYFAYVEQALEQNLIDIGDGSFNPEGTVTREEMAELIVRALGYNSLARYDHIFVDSFNDSASINNKGQAAIVVGLNIMSTTKDGKFQPAKEVQRAEAATAFFRYLQARSELQEAPLRM